MFSYLHTSRNWSLIDNILLVPSRWFQEERSHRFETVRCEFCQFILHTTKQWETKDQFYSLLNFLGLWQLQCNNKPIDSQILITNSGAPLFEQYWFRQRLVCWYILWSPIAQILQSEQSPPSHEMDEFRLWNLVFTFIRAINSGGELSGCSESLAGHLLWRGLKLFETPFLLFFEFKKKCMLVIEVKLALSFANYSRPVYLLIFCL